MLTQFELKISILLYRYSSLVCSIPYDVHVENGREPTLKPTTSKFKLYFWYFNVISVCLHCLYLFVVLIVASTVHTKLMRPNEYWPHIAICIAYAFGVLLQLNTVFFRHEAMNFVNRYLHLEFQLARKYGQTFQVTEKRNTELFLTLALFGYLAVSTPFMNGFLFLEHSKSPTYYHFYFQSSHKDFLHYAKLGGFVLWEIFFSGEPWAVVLYYAVLSLSYVHTNIRWLHEISNERKKYATHSEIRRPSDVIRVYRTLQLMNKDVNDFLGTFLMPIAKCLILTLMSCGFFGSIRMYGIIKFPAYFVMPCLAFGCLLYSGAAWGPFGILFTLCESFKHSWKLSTPLHSFIQSCLPLRMEIGCFYYIRRATVLIFLAIVLECTINLLLL